MQIYKRDLIVCYRRNWLSSYAMYVYSLEGVIDNLFEKKNNFFEHTIGMHSQDEIFVNKVQ